MNIVSSAPTAWRSASVSPSPSVIAPGTSGKVTVNPPSSAGVSVTG
jgi:hypothetical protein